MGNWWPVGHTLIGLLIMMIFFFYKPSLNILYIFYKREEMGDQHPGSSRKNGTFVFLYMQMFLYAGVDYSFNIINYHWVSDIRLN